MTHENSLMRQIAAPANLLAAWRSVRGNVPRYRRMRSSGPDGVTLEEFEHDLAAQLDALRHGLLNGSYQPQPPGRFTIPKRDGRQREIAILPIADRVAQRATQQVLEPLWEPVFLPCSYGFRPGRSVQDAVLQARALRQRGNNWVVDGDIAACFDQLDHQILLGRLRRRVPDERVIALVNQWLEAGVMHAGLPEEQKNPFAGGVKRISTKVRQGWDWALQAVVPPDDPYLPPRYEPVGWPAERGNEDDDDIPLLEDPAALLRKRAVRQMATGGLLMASSWLRPTAASLVRAAGGALRTPAGRRALQKGLLATGGVTGAATGVLFAAYFLYQRFSPTTAGILQGSPLSPLLANIYLHAFDVGLTRSKYRLVRFADDWVILCPNQEQAELGYNEAVRCLARLKLQINREKTHILAPGDPLEWLGMTID